MGRLQGAMHMELEIMGRPLSPKKIVWQETSIIVIKRLLVTFW